MLFSFVAILRRVVHALLASDSPRQLAAGFTLGMIIGLVPKGNLIALSLCVLLFSLRINTGMGLVAALLFSWFGAWADPLTHKLGLAVLHVEPLQASYASVFNLPLGPWIGFNNTVVAGSLVLGLYLAYPVYWIIRVSCARLQAPAAAWLRQRRVTRWLLGADAHSQSGAAP